jgi:hypothetical protein
MDEADEEEVIARLSAQHGLRRLPGRFFKGTERDLRERPEQLETAQMKAGERWIHLLHPTVSQKLVVNELTDGPFKGWSRLDEVRSEVLTLVRPLKEAQGLAPGQLRANTHAWFGGTKLRKSHDFALWAAEAMRLIETYPATAFDWMRIAPHALDWAKNGGRLHYLYKSVDWQPSAGGTPLHRPHASLSE